MTRQQAVFIIALNATISLVISLLVVWLVGPRRAGLPSALPHSLPADLPAAEAALPPEGPSPGQPGLPVTPTPILHRVKEGETLLWIAMKYDVSVEAIMEANDLVNPDVLAVGQELIIPAPETEPTAEVQPAAEAGPVAETATATPSPTKAGPSPTPPSTPVGEYRLEITQIVARGRQEAEVLVLTNYGRDVRLQGWTLSNDRGKVYTFPNLTLFRGNSVRIYTSKGRNTPSDLYWGLDSAAWGTDAQVAMLKDVDGKVQATKDLE